MQTKIRNLLIMLFIMLILVGTITAIMTSANLPATQSFINAWLRSFSFALLVMLPLGGVIFASLNKLIKRLLPSGSHLQKNLLLGVCMALTMESIMAVITMLNSHTIESFTQFSNLFLNSLLYGLPVGLSFSFFMTLVIKPRLQKHLTNQTA